MATNDRTQARLVGQPSGAELIIETSGRVIRPLLAVPGALVDECRLEADADGLHISVRDPANVAQLRLTAYPDAFDDYEIQGGDETVVGTNLTELTDRLADARLGKRTDDPVELRVDKSRTSITIERDYDTTTVTRRHEYLNIDPDSIREQPDDPGIDCSCSAEVDPAAYTDTIEHLNTLADHVAIINRSGRLQMGAQGDDDGDGDRVAASTADFGDIVDSDDGDAAAWYSLDYHRTFADAISDGKITDCELHWGDEFPLRLAFKRRGEDDTLLYEGSFFMAPRIKDSSDAEVFAHDD